MRDVLQVLMDLVRIPSTNPPGNEHLIAPYLANFLRELGAQITCQEVYPGRSNIIGEWSWGRGHRLLFNTHMDVHNPEGQVWSMDPFEPVLHNGRLYGRGTADAKGSLAAMLCAIERLVRTPEAERARSFHHSHGGRVWRARHSSSDFLWLCRRWRCRG